MGAKALAKRVRPIQNKGNAIKWVLNLELTGKGGRNFIHSSYGQGLSNILKEFKPLALDIEIPQNECRELIKEGNDSEVITTIPVINGVPDFSILKNSHSLDDSLENISIDDMVVFVNEVLLPLSKL